MERPQRQQLKASGSRTRDVYRFGYKKPCARNSVSHLFGWPFLMFIAGKAMAMVMFLQLDTITLLWEQAMVF